VLTIYIYIYIYVCLQEMIFCTWCWGKQSHIWDYLVKDWYTFALSTMLMYVWGIWYWSLSVNIFCWYTIVCLSHSVVNTVMLYIWSMDCCHGIIIHLSHNLFISWWHSSSSWKIGIRIQHLKWENCKINVFRLLIRDKCKTIIWLITIITCRNCKISEMKLIKDN